MSQLPQPAPAGRQRIAGQQVEHHGRQTDQEVAQKGDGRAERGEDGQQREGQCNRQRQERKTQGRVPNASRVPQTLRDAAVGVALGGVDGYFEHRLRERKEHAATEDDRRDAPVGGQVRKVQGHPDEVHDHAQIGELERDPHVGSAGQHLNLVADPFGQIQERRVDAHRLSLTGSYSVG